MNWLDYLGSGAQGASNAAASVVGSPIDLAESVVNLLRAGYGYGGHKLGLLDPADMPEMLSGSVGTTEWMRKRGLVREPKERVAWLLGEAAGMITPAVAASKAPQIASGLLGAARNLSAPTKLHPQRGLMDLGQDSRLRRMTDQGYDPNWFHGHAGQPFQAFDAARAGSVTGTPPSRVATFLTRNQDDAMEFARNADAAIGGGASVMQTAVRPKKPAVVVWKDTYPPIRSDGGQRFLAGMLEDAKEQGFDAVVIRGGNDSLSGKSAADIMAVLDTGIARDVRRAEFDPARLGQAGLTLGAGSLGLGLMDDK